jgi:hypothetical protein
MSWNVSWVRALRAIVMAGLLIALIYAVLGSIGLRGHPRSWPERAVAPDPASGMTFGTTVPR